MATFSRKPGYLHIDLETYSSVDLAECGVYRYAESEDFEILLFGYSVDDGPVKVIEHPTPETLYDSGFVKLLMDPRIIKVAHNAAFERTCLSTYIRKLPQTIINTYRSPDAREPLDFL